MIEVSRSPLTVSQLRTDVPGGSVIGRPRADPSVLPIGPKQSLKRLRNAKPVDHHSDGDENHVEDAGHACETPSSRMNVQRKYDAEDDEPGAHRHIDHGTAATDRAEK